MSNASGFVSGLAVTLAVTVGIVYLVVPRVVDHNHDQGRRRRAKAISA